MEFPLHIYFHHLLVSGVTVFSSSEASHIFGLLFFFCFQLLPVYVLNCGLCSWWPACALCVVSSAKTELTDICVFRTVTLYQVQAVCDRYCSDCWVTDGCEHFPALSISGCE